MKKLLLRTFSTAVILLALLVGLRIFYGYTSAYTLWSTIMPTPGATVPLQYGLSFTNNVSTTGTVSGNYVTANTMTAGTLNATTIKFGSNFTIASVTTAYAPVNCGTGYIAVSGGANCTGASDYLTVNCPSNSSGTCVTSGNATQYWNAYCSAGGMQIYALCVPN